jgi:uncharacterized membrane protein (GlpM family)
MKKLFVCALAVALVFAFTAPTMAASEWSFYGNVQFDTFSKDVSKEQNTGRTNYSDTDTEWALNGIGRFGAKAVAGDVMGNFELNDGANLRHLYGEWNFGAGKLLVGQTWSLSDNGTTGQNATLGMAATQNAAPGRTPQIRLTFGGFQISGNTPTVNTAFTNTAGATVAPVDSDTTLPKMEARYTFATDMFSVVPYAAWQTVDYVYALDTSYSLTSTVFGISGKVNFGPAWVQGNLWSGTNVGDMGWSGASTNALWDAVNLKYVDATTLTYGLGAGFKASDMISLEACYAVMNSEYDVAGAKVEDPTQEYFIQAVITLAPGVQLIPEYAKIDYDDRDVAGVSTKQGDISYIGATWKISF